MSKAEDLAGLLDANGDVLATNLDNVSVAFADLTGKPTTISGYGITDAFDGTYSSLTGAPTAVSSFTNDSGYATTTYVDGEIANLVASAPATLDTLNELAAALGDDANFSTTVTNSIATKAALSGADFTGNVTTTGNVGIGTTSPSGALEIKDTNNETYAFITNNKAGGSGQAVLVLRNDVGNWQVKCMTDDTFVVRDNGQASDRMIIDSSGNVGIGTTDNLGKLTAQGTITAKASADQSTIALSHNGSQGIISVSYGSTGSYDPMSFKTSDAENMRLETDGDLHVDGDVIAFSTTISDARLKTNIQGIENAVSKVGQLNGYTFEYIADGKVSAGVIAQEVEQVLPEAVQEKELPLKADDGEQYKVVNYDALHGLLIEAVKELSARVEALEAK